MRKLIRNIRTAYFTYIAKRKIVAWKGILRVNYKSIFNNHTYLGDNCHFNGMNILGGGNVYIGDNFHSGSECLMITQNHNYEGKAVPYDNTYIYKDIQIGDNVWLGNRVIVLGGVKIGEGAIIQAGSVVVSDIEKYGIAGGHPAKVFNYRNKFHYEQLKNEGSFH